VSERRPALMNDPEHAKDCHKRWMARRHRRQESPDYKDEWRTQQCFSCRFFVPLMGSMKEDYGACTNPTSPFDGRVMFEHDGCDHHEAVEE
jgi:Protein of unknown function (DUF3027)